MNLSYVKIAATNTIRNQRESHNHVKISSNAEVNDVAEISEIVNISNIKSPRGNHNATCTNSGLVRERGLRASCKSEKQL